MGRCDCVLFDTLQRTMIILRLRGNRSRAHRGSLQWLAPCLNFVVCLALLSACASPSSRRGSEGGGRPSRSDISDAAPVEWDLSDSGRGPLHVTGSEHPKSGQLVLTIHPERKRPSGIALDIRVWNVGETPTKVFRISPSRYHLRMSKDRVRDSVYYRWPVNGLPTPTESDMSWLDYGNYLGARFVLDDFYVRTSNEAELWIQVEASTPSDGAQVGQIASEWVRRPP